MSLVKPSELWFDYCERVGLDPYNREQPDYIYFKKLYGLIIPHQKGLPVLEVDRCWIWKGHFNVRGYPYLGAKLANRQAYIYFKGLIEAGKKLYRTCLNRVCVNPYHAFPSTQQEILLASENSTTNKTHCPSGHPYDEKNTYHDRTNRRRCRLCGREHAKVWRLKLQKEKGKKRRVKRRRKNPG